MPFNGERHTGRHRKDSCYFVRSCTVRPTRVPGAIMQASVIAVDAMQKTAQLGPDTAGRQFGILVVDDEAALRKMLHAGLSAHGFPIWLADSGKSAIDIYQQHRNEIQLVLLDIRMPGIDGVQTLGRLREINPDVRCWLMTGDAGRHAQDGLLACDAHQLVLKPFRLQDLLAQIRQVECSHS